MGDKKMIDFANCEVVGERGTSLEIVVPLTKDGSRRKTVWIPRKMIGEESECFDYDENRKGKLFIPEWLAKDRGLM